MGGDAQENAKISMSIFRGELGAPRDAVLLNAAAAIAAFEGNLEVDIRTRINAGLERAKAAIDSGAALALVQKWAALSQELSVS